jgi:hypothetical protein
MPLSVQRATFDQDWRFHHAVYDVLSRKAKGDTRNDLDWSDLEDTLRPVEFDTLLVLQFIYSWENSGSFIDTVSVFDNLFDEVDRAFRRLGFGVASVLMSRALELHAARPVYNDDSSLPPELAAEAQRIKEAASADVSEERLTKAIVEREHEFDV